MTTIAIRKTAWGLSPADRQTEDLIRATDVDAVIRAKVLEDQRSLSQNRLYWMWLTEIGRAQGYTKDELHDRCKRHYVLPVLVRDDEDYARFLDQVQGMGTEAEELFIRRFISTTDLSVRQFAEVLTEIEIDANHRGIRLTRPDELYWQALEREAERAA